MTSVFLVLFAITVTMAVTQKTYGKNFTLLEGKITSGGAEIYTIMEETMISIQNNGKHVCTACVYNEMELLSTAACARKILPFIMETCPDGGPRIRACSPFIPRESSPCLPIDGIKLPNKLTLDYEGFYQGSFDENNFALIVVKKPFPVQMRKVDIPDWNSVLSIGTEMSVLGFQSKRTGESGDIVEYEEKLSVIRAKVIQDVDIRTHFPGCRGTLHGQTKCIQICTDAYFEIEDVGSIVDLYGSLEFVHGIVSCISQNRKIASITRTRNLVGPDRKEFGAIMRG